jgi:diguanylate cyclase (GGDEF)-like protein
MHQEELKVLASTDSMTKLYNRRYFSNISEHILDLAKRDNTDTSVIMLDIDKFKIVNDTYGHKVGDEVIISLAQKLQELSRKSDIVCRFGGEEFVILLPETAINGALTISEKIKSEIENTVIPLANEKELKFTVSIGVSQVNNKEDMNIETPIYRADKALYQAKENGRNTICSN